MQVNQHIFRSLVDEKTGRVRDDVASAIRSAVRDAFVDRKLDLEKQSSKPDVHKPNVDDRLDISTANVEEIGTIKQPIPDQPLDIKMPGSQNLFDKMDALTDKLIGISESIDKIHDQWKELASNLEQLSFPENKDVVPTSSLDVSPFRAKL